MKPTTDDPIACKRQAIHSAILHGVMLLCLLVVLIAVIPAFAETYEGGGGLPRWTYFTISVSRFLRHYFLQCHLIAAALLWADVGVSSLLRRRYGYMSARRWSIGVVILLIACYLFIAWTLLIPIYMQFELIP